MSPFLAWRHKIISFFQNSFFFAISQENYCFNTFSSPGLDLNDTYREKLFYSIQYKGSWLAASDLFFTCLHNQVLLYILLLRINITDVWKMLLIK